MLSKLAIDQVRAAAATSRDAFAPSSASTAMAAAAAAVANRAQLRPAAHTKTEQARRNTGMLKRISESCETAGKSAHQRRRVQF